MHLTILLQPTYILTPAPPKEKCLELYSSILDETRSRSSKPLPHVSSPQGETCTWEEVKMRYHPGGTETHFGQIFGLTEKKEISPKLRMSSSDSLIILSDQRISSLRSLELYRPEISSRRVSYSRTLIVTLYDPGL